MRKINKIKKEAKAGLFMLGIFGLLALSGSALAAASEFQYTLLEGLPGFFNAGGVMTDFPALVLAVYKFGIWTIGISGMFMITVGGIMYAGSAGNTSTANSAKGIITDSLIGIAAAMIAYLFLYVINPDLTQMNINFTPVNVDEKIGPGPGATGSKNCKPILDNKNPCSVDNLKKFAQSKGMVSGVDAWATRASSICNAESSGKPNNGSIEGKCNGSSIAWGLFQINLNAHCPGAIKGKWKRGVVGGGCTVGDQAIYDKCKSQAIDVTWNLNKMWELYNKNGWRPWEVTLNGMCN